MIFATHRLHINEINDLALSRQVINFIGGPPGLEPGTKGIQVCASFLTLSRQAAKF